MFPFQARWLLSPAARAINMGRAFAVALARLGADISVHHHGTASKSDAEETARLVREHGTRTIIVDGDLTDTKVVKHLFEATLGAFGRVDIVINNAGLVIKKPFTDISEAEFDRSFGINAKAAFFVMQEAARCIADNGRIINMGTTRPFPSIRFMPGRRPRSKISPVRWPGKSAGGASPSMWSRPGRSTIPSITVPKRRSRLHGQRPPASPAGWGISKTLFR